MEQNTQKGRPKKFTEKAHAHVICEKSTLEKLKNHAKNNAKMPFSEWLIKAGLAEIDRDNAPF